MTLETYLEGAELDSTTTENLIHAVNAFQNKEITLDEIVEEYGMWYKCIIQNLLNERAEVFANILCRNKFKN
tara:strand:+ start:114 stop:329 length:216 start_codon:yes stop_codon:yes gene_type:complete